MLFNSHEHFLLKLRLSVGFGDVNRRRRRQFDRKHRRIVLPGQSRFHHAFDDLPVHGLDPIYLMAGRDFGELFRSELLLDKEHPDLPDHRIAHRKADFLHRYLNEFFRASGDLSDVLLRSEIQLVPGFCHITQRVQNVLFSLKMLVKRRRFDSDTFRNLPDTCSVVALLT